MTKADKPSASVGFTGVAKEMIDRAVNGQVDDVDFIIGHLTHDVTLSITRIVDYALGLVETDAGVERVEYYLFNGAKIQRNYATLFLGRRGDWDVVNRAFSQGLIDDIQAYAR